METNEIRINETQTKVCSKCGRELPVSEFNKSSKSRDGLQYYCRTCQHGMQRNSYQKAKAAGPRMATPTSNSPLSAFKPRELIQELINRGYKGELTYTHTIKL